MNLNEESLQPCKAVLRIAGRMALTALALGAQLPAHAQRYAEDDYAGSFNILVWVIGIAVFTLAWLRKRVRHWWNPERAEAEDKADDERRRAERTAIDIAVDAHTARGNKEREEWVEHCRRQTEATLPRESFQEFRRKLRLKNGWPLDE